MKMKWTHLIRTGGWCGIVVSASLLAGAVEPNTLSKAEKQAPKEVRLHWEPLYEPGCGGWITGVAVSPHDPQRVLVGGDVMGVGVSEDGGDSWQPTFGFSMWEINDFTFHPTDPLVIWVGTLGGPYVSLDGGHHWQSRRTGFPPPGDTYFSAPIEKILFWPGDSTRLLAFGGSHRGLSALGKPLWGAVWESLDSGTSWRQVATVADGSFAANIVSALFAGGQAETLYVAARGKGVYLSTDGGRTWVARKQGLPDTTGIGRLVAHPTRKDILWVSLGSYRVPGKDEHQPGGVYKTTDGGSRWEPASNGLKLQGDQEGRQPSSYKALGVAPTNPDLLLTCDWPSWGRYDYRDVDGRNEILWGPTTFKSTDGTASWRPVLKYRTEEQGRDTAYFCFDNTVFEFDPHTADRAFLGSTMCLLRTQDAGKTWTDATSYRPDANRRDAWRGRGFSGLCSSQFAFHPHDPQHTVLLGLDDAFWQSRDGLRSWQRVPAVGSANHARTANDITFAGEGGRVIYVLLSQFNFSFTGIARSTDSGRTWTDLYGAARGLPERSQQPQGTPLDQAIGIYALPDQPEQVWATIGGQLYHSTDSGEHWSVIHDGPGLLWIAPVPGQPRSFYVSSGEGIYFTEDGAKFTLLPGSPRINRWMPGRLAVDTSKPHRLYLAQYADTPGKGGLWRWADGVWTKLMDQLGVVGVAVDPTDPSRVAVATTDVPIRDVTIASGVWLSDDAGVSWSQQNNGLPCLRGKVLAINPHDPEQLIFGSEGRGYFVARWPKR
jgi:photosystem II stability/assembly factor-like uncharacterized protein